MSTKICLGPCGRTLEVNEENFYRQSKGRETFQSRCKACFSQQTGDRLKERYSTDEEYRKRILEKSAERYQNDEEYRAKKIERAAKHSRERYQEDKEGYNLYIKAHYQVKKVNGPAAGYLCVCGCGKQAKDWALKNDSENIKTSKHYKWSDNVEDYMPMSRSCHKNYDNGREMEVTV